MEFFYFQIVNGPRFLNSTESKTERNSNLENIWFTERNRIKRNLGMNAKI
jgi:hypothetical protein